MQYSDTHMHANIFKHTGTCRNSSIVLLFFVAAEDGWIDGVFVGSYRGHSSFLFVVMFLTAHYERISWTFPVQYTELQCQVISAHCQVVFSSPSGASQC